MKLLRDLLVVAVFLIVSVIVVVIVNIHGWRNKPIDISLTEVYRG